MISKNRCSYTKVIQLNKYNKYIKTFNSIKDATIETGCHHSNIVAVCKFRLSSAWWYIWRYEDN